MQRSGVCVSFKQGRSCMLVVVYYYLQIQQAEHSAPYKRSAETDVSPLFTALSLEVHFVVSFDSFNQCHSFLLGFDIFVTAIY